MSVGFYQLGDYQSTLNTAEKVQENCREVLTKNPDHTQAKNVMAESKNLVGNVYELLAEKNSQNDLWQKALENFRASLEIYIDLKAQGKFTALNEKKVADLNTAIVKSESKINK